MVAVTRLGLYGGSRGPYGDFSTKEADSTAPILTSALGTATGQTTADLQVDTDEANGTLYWVVTQSDTSPSAAQVKAGTDENGDSPDDSGSQSVSATGTIEVSGGATGLTAGTTYYVHFMHEDAATNQSDVLTSASFQTTAAAAAAVGSGRMSRRDTFWGRPNIYDQDADEREPKEEEIRKIARRVVRLAVMKGGIFDLETLRDMAQSEIENTFPAVDEKAAREQVIAATVAYKAAIAKARARDEDAAALLLL